MHVTLISPPQVFSKSQVTAGVVPPLGILYLDAYLNKFNIETTVIDAVGDKYEQYTEHGGGILRGMTLAEIVDRIPTDTDLIGVSAIFSSAFLVNKELISLIKERFSTRKVVLGGAHSTTLPEFTLKNTKADCVVLGEGEHTLLNLCRNLDDYEEVMGIVYKKNGGIYSNPKQELIQNLDEIPFPDRGKIKLENYFKAAEPHGCSFSRRWTTMLASRGCPYQCTFCTTPFIWRRHWRPRNVDDVVREMVELNEKHGITDFHFEDENLGLNKEWFHRFCDTLIARKLKFSWQPSNGLRAETLLAPGLMKKMKASGCSLVVFTLESASDRVRNEIIRKKLDISSVEKAVFLAKKIGIKSSCYFMIGLPGEYFQEAKETVDYASYLGRKGLDECVISLFSMLPGCEMFNNLYRQGKIELDARFFQDLLTIGDLARFKSWSENISSDQLKRLRFYGYLKFLIIKTLFHPLKLLGSLWNLARGRDQLKSERVIRTFLKRLLFWERPFSRQEMCK